MNIEKKTIITIALSLFVIVTIIVLGFLVFSRNKNSLDNKINFESDSLAISEYVIYGTNLNITTKITDNNYDNVKLYLWSKNEKINIPIETTIKNNYIQIKTSYYVNQGINLENLKNGDYELILVTEKNNSEKKKNEMETKYYYFHNDTTYSNLEYYTITKNGKNQRVNMNWDNNQHLLFKIEDTKLPDNVYDIAIDPGHSGIDGGAEGTLNGIKYNERNLNLTICLELKEQLEKLGYKVGISRTDNETGIGIYNSGGSAVYANEKKAKYNFAVHNNSSITKNTYSGLEIYIVNNLEFSLVRNFVKNILTYGNTTASNKDSYYVEPGIYRRNFSLSDIDISIADAKKIGYDPYNITTMTTYYYYLRETGGITTGAYVDGRNPNIVKNPFYNSNHTAESYLFELSYMNTESDLKNMLDNYKGYAKGIATGLDEYIKK